MVQSFYGELNKLCQRGPGFFLPGFCFFMTLLFLLFLMDSSSASSSLSPINSEINSDLNSEEAGRYGGYLSFENGKKILATLDLFVVKNLGKQSESNPTYNRPSDFYLKGILKVYLGSFSSKEYITYSFGKIERDDQQRIFLTDSSTDASSELEIQEGRFSFRTRPFSHSPLKIFKGQIRAKTSLLRGSLELVSFQELTPEEFLKIFPRTQGIIEELEGEYEGVCSGQKKVLQLQTAKGLNEKEWDGAQPFESYLIRGSLGSPNQRICPYTEANGNEICISSSYFSGAYDPYVGELTLRGYPDLKCTVEGNNLSCGKECVLSKVNPPLKFTGAGEVGPEELPPLIQNKLNLFEDVPSKEKITNLSPVEKIQGQFVGYLFHEHRQLYQLFELDISAFRRGDPSQILLVSLAGNLVFGPLEKISFKFLPREGLPFYSALSTPEDSFNQTTLRIEEWNEDKIKGTFYNQVFGRVGPFELVRKNSFKNKLPPSLLIAPLHAQTYASPLWNYYFKVLYLTEHNSENHQNPYYPLTVGGLMDSSRLRLSVNFMRGSYDFFFGAIGLVLGDQKLVNGWVYQETMLLNLPSFNQIGVRMKRHPRLREHLSLKR